MKKVVLFFLIMGLPAFAWGATLPSENTGAVLQRDEQLEKGRELEKQIQTPRTTREEVPVTAEAGLAGEERKVLVRKINVKGATLIPQDVVTGIVGAYEDRELSLQLMQEVCARITDEYRKRGFITSRAYMPPQTIGAADGVLVIIVIEGKVGQVTVTGNKYYSSAVINKRLEMKPGEHFDYPALQRAMAKVNDHPDRFIKANLVPGTEPGTTDVLLEVKDRLPVHAAYEVDNFASKYLNSVRHAVKVEHNNVTGHDDRLAFRYQTSSGPFYRSPYISYQYPVNNRLDVGGYWLWTRTKLAREYKARNIRGKGSIGGPSFDFEVLNRDAVSLKWTGGFDYKSVINYENGAILSRDEDRVVKTGLNLDTSDKFGRTILTVEEAVGLVMGGLYKKDPLATTPGAGAKFQKVSGSLYRLQPMPFSSAILWKNYFQYSNYNLLSIEQFQLGGISNVRGFAPAEYSGDKGFTSTVDWSFPVYFLSRKALVPHSKTTFFDATRFVVFYDYGYASLHNAPAGATSRRSLHGYGAGLRFNLLEDLSSRIEVGFPTGSDIEWDDARIYWEFKNTASCSDRIRTNTSCTIPAPINEGVRVVIKIR